MTASCGVVGAHVEAGQAIGRMEIERVKRACPLVICSVHRILAAAHLEARREAGHVGKVFAPVDAECIAIAMGYVIGDARNGVVSFAVERFGIVDRTRKAAASEDVGGGVNPAGIGD